jgi:hypothetical protein
MEISCRRESKVRFFSLVLYRLHGRRGGLLGVLSLVLAQSLGPPLGPPVQDPLPVLVHLKLHDGDLAGVDSNTDGGPVGLLSLDPLNVDPQLGPVALHHLSHLLTLVVAPDHLDLVVLPAGHGLDPILLPQKVLT